MKKVNDEQEFVGYVVDSDGVALDTIYTGDKIVHKADMDKQHLVPNQYDMDFNKGANFVKMYDDVVYVLAQRLTASEFTIAMSLSHFVSFGDCMLQNGANNNGKPLTVKEIAKELGKEYTRFSKTFNNLIAKGVIGKFTFETGDIKTGEIKKLSGYFANPYIYTRGTRVHKTVLKLFADTGWKELIIG